MKYQTKGPLSRYKLVDSHQVLSKSDLLKRNPADKISRQTNWLLYAFPSWKIKGSDKQSSPQLDCFFSLTVYSIFQIAVLTNILWTRDQITKTLVVKDKQSKFYVIYFNHQQYVTLLWLEISFPNLIRCENTKLFHMPQQRLF